MCIWFRRQTGIAFYMRITKWLFLDITPDGYFLPQFLSEKPPSDDDDNKRIFLCHVSQLLSLPFLAPTQNAHKGLSDAPVLCDLRGLGVEVCRAGGP